MNAKYDELWIPDWHTYFMVLAKVAAWRSSCFSRQLGVVIVGINGKDAKQVLATGYNGALSGQKSCQEMGFCYYREHGLPKSSCLSNHAEANAIEMAAKRGISVYGSRIYLLLTPCYRCAKEIVTAGIKEVIYLDTHMVLDDIDTRIKELFNSSNIKYMQLDRSYFKEAAEFIIKDSQDRQIPEYQNLIEEGRKDGHN